MFLVIKTYRDGFLASGEKTYFGPFVNIDAALIYADDLLIQRAGANWDIQVSKMNIPITRTGGTAKGYIKLD